MANGRIWDEYLRFCEIRKDALSTGVCKPADLEGLGPTAILPLVDFLGKGNVRFISPGFDTGPGAWRHSTASPVLTLPSKQRDVGGVLAKMSELHDGGRRFGGRNTFMYLIGELVHNVYDHSSSNHASIMGQEREEGSRLEIAILDDGITVGGSLRRAGMILDDDVMAIAMAINGLSSKGEGRRGYGLRSNVKMCIEGLGGSVLMVSGHGAVELRMKSLKGDLAQEAYRIEDNVYHLEGTLVSVRIPLQEKEVDLYEFA